MALESENFKLREENIKIKEEWKHGLRSVLKDQRHSIVEDDVSQTSYKRPPSSHNSKPPTLSRFDQSTTSLASADYTRSQPDMHSFGSIRESEQ